MKILVFVLLMCKWSRDPPWSTHARYWLLMQPFIVCFVLSKRLYQNQCIKSTKQDFQGHTWLLIMFFFFTFLFSSKLYNFLVSFNFFNFRNENSYNVLESDWGGCKSNPNQPKKLNFNESASFQRSKAIQKKKEKKKRNKKKNQK